MARAGIGLSKTPVPGVLVAAARSGNGPSFTPVSLAQQLHLAGKRGTAVPGQHCQVADFVGNSMVPGLDGDFSCPPAIDTDCATGKGRGRRNVAMGFLGAFALAYPVPPPQHRSGFGSEFEFVCAFISPALHCNECNHVGVPLFPVLFLEPVQARLAHIVVSAFYKRAAIF